MIDKDGKVYRGLQAQVAYLTEKVENGGGGTATGPTVDKITSLDLAIGDAAVTYDANDGASLSKQGQIKAGGNTYTIEVEDELPIVPGDNITIDATEDGKHLKISASGGGGGGVAGVSSFGGKTGAINVGTNLSMNGNVVNADFKPTPVVIETTSDADASSGTLTANQLATLQANTANPIVKRNEYYYLNDNQHVTGTLGYTHIGYESGTWYTKNITITISTRGWVRTTDTIPEEAINPFVELVPSSSSYPISGNFTAEQAIKLVGQPFSVISYRAVGSADNIPLLLQPSETIHNSYVYSGHDDTYTYTINATLSVTSGNTWLTKSYVITREAYVAPVTTTIDGVSGEITLGANLHLENKILSGTNTVTTVNGHTGAVNIVNGNNVTISDVGGTLTISASGGSATFPAVDLTNATVPVSGEFTNEQADLLYYVNNKASFIMIQDTIGGLATYIVLPLVYLDSIHNDYTYQATVSGNTYTLDAILQKTTGDVWGIKTYTITKAAAAGGSKLYQHTLTLQYTGVSDTYSISITLINSNNEQLSLTPFLNIYGTDPINGYWPAVKASTGKLGTNVIKIAATSNGFVATDSSVTDHDATFISDTVKEV